ncbi:MAG: hypothetical protein HY292_02690, partial [Planctomycetes bacterium]|nr:hypothetical protein [Planctomycetota bacterium]
MNDIRGAVFFAAAVFSGLAGADAQTTRLITRAFDGGPSNGHSNCWDISADGRYVLFTSDATNLVPNDTNGVADIFHHDRLTQRTTRVNVTSSGEQANG